MTAIGLTDFSSARSTSPSLEMSLQSRPRSAEARAVSTCPPLETVQVTSCETGTSGTAKANSTIPGLKTTGWPRFAVPDVPVSQDVTWTVSSGGQVDTARASADLGRDCRLISSEGDVDLALEKSVRPIAVMVGERVEYTIVVRNLGTTATGAVTVLDRQLDRRVEVLSATRRPGRCSIRRGGASPQRVLCVLRDVGPGESATIVVAARSLEPGVARNRATVVSVPIDVGANNSATAGVTVEAASRVSPGVASERRRPFTG